MELLAPQISGAVDSSYCPDAFEKLSRSLYRSESRNVPKSGASSAVKVPPRRWGQDFFTAPAADREDYKYLAFGWNHAWNHASNSGALRTENLKERAASLKEAYAAFAQRPIFSASIITPDRHETFAEVGFLLDAPQTAQVLVTGSSDLGTPRGQTADLDAIRKRYAYRGPIDDPARVIELTKPGRYNEVLIAGNAMPEMSAPNIVGLFYRVDPDGTRFISREEYRALREISAEHRLPLVPVVTEHVADFKDAPLSIDGGVVAMSANGVSFTLQQGGNVFRAVKRAGRIDVSTAENLSVFLEGIRKKARSDRAFRDSMCGELPEFCRRYGF